jgi:hypothetical protein
MCKRKIVLIKVNVSGGNQPVRHRIIAAIAFGVSQVTKEDAWKGAWGEFMRGNGESARIATASENPKTIIGGR